MATRQELLIEANNRGLLTGQKKAAFDEAVSRGLIVTPQVPTQVQQPVQAPIQPTAQPGTLPLQAPQLQPQQAPGVPIQQQPVEVPQPVQPQQEEPGLLEETATTLAGGITSLVEPALTLLSGAAAEPVAGIVGIVQALNPFAEEGAGARAVEDVREALTFVPRTEGGQQSLETVSNLLQPVAQVLQSAERKLGDETLEATGSPALAAAAATAPTAILEILGIAAAKGSIKASDRIKKASETAAVKKSVVESVPQIDQLKDTARAVYNELDQSGVTVKKGAFTGLVNKIDNDLKRQGFDPDITPKAAAALNRFKSEIGASPNLSEVDTLRKVAQKAAQSVDPADASLGSAMIESIDQFLDNAKPSAFNRGDVPLKDISGKYQVARGLWGRARRSELLNDAVEKATLQATGFENGLRTQFRSILNNKKKTRFFKPDELAVMRKVVQGGPQENILKFIGKFGFGEGQATSALGAAIGGGAGFAVAGGPGAIAVPIIGTVSRKLAQRLTRKNAEFADQVVRAGPDAEAIAAVYIRNTPKAKQSSSELSELLLRPDIALDDLATSSNKVLKDAADIARGRRTLQFAAGAAAPGAARASQQQQVTDISETEIGTQSQ